MKIQDIMSRPVHTVQMDDSLKAVRDSFFSHGCHHVVVLERQKVYGVVSDRDVLKELSPFVGNQAMERPQDANTLKRRVHQIMSRTPVTIGPDEFVAAAAQRMIEKRVSSLPVVDKEGKLVGIVTQRDILKWAVSACPLPQPVVEVAK
ncbi:MAG: CBS domain-containing protein [Phycisphaerales bacterium]|nr:CBS domain-containing protein [Phycisphaerales bacterium]MCB9855455.1 CBS domain-containing protein [Phycisphaerales bacterium]MCB9864231.1 CBS domain-containing protein [Phycisphaerales bacterium]